jgi:hypothetical protein
MVIDDSLSYDFSESGYDYRADHYYKEDISYSIFNLHGPISLTDKS